MLALTRKVDYGLVALTLLARRRAARSGPLSAAQIAAEYELPRALLMNVLKELNHARIVSATRGAAGGYELAIEPQQLSLLEVITALEGPVRLTACADGLPIVGQGCNLESDCPIRGPIRRLHGRLHRLLEETTLADLLDDAAVDPCVLEGRDPGSCGCATHRQPQPRSQGTRPQPLGLDVKT